MLDELLEIADDAQNDWITRMRGDEEIQVANYEAINCSRLRVDTRKWLLSKALPKINSDRFRQQAARQRVQVVRYDSTGTGATSTKR